jgi:MoaA/NifB/PqqE/SkfB family radical SAM enzyme
VSQTWTRGISRVVGSFLKGKELPSPGKTGPGLTVRQLLQAGRRVLTGRPPMLSIEITRECPLRCPGCYAYGDTHLGSGVTLRQLADRRGDELVDGILALVRRHRPIHVSLVGGEPLVRHRELSRILPALSAMGVYTLVVTSGVIPVPLEWMQLPRVRVAVSVDGLPEHHDERRKPATYSKILENIRGCSINIHWTITRPMLSRSTYLEEYVSFWSGRPEVNRIWVSVYSPQVGEISNERLSGNDRRTLVDQLVPLCRRYPKLLMNAGIGAAFLDPPRSPDQCLFSKMSVNYSADLSTRVEPCVFGGTPDCSQCGCAISAGLHWIQGRPVAGSLTVGHLARGFVGIGSLSNSIRSTIQPRRWKRELVPDVSSSSD